MEYIYNIDVSLSGESRFEYVPAVQGDIKSRYLKITLYADSQIFIVPDNVIAILRCKRRDGLIILSKCTLNNDGSLIAMLTNQMLAKAGDLKCEIALYDSTDNSRLTSTAFTVKVHAALTSETQIPDDDNDDDVENKEGLIAFYEKGGTLPAGEPKNDNHVTTKKYVDDKLDGKLNKVASDIRVYPGIYATTDTDGTPQLITATSDLSYIGTGSGYIPLYEAGGQLKTATPTADDSAANKGYVDEQIAIHLGAKGIEPQNETYSQLNPVVAEYLENTTYSPSDYTVTQIDSYINQETSYNKSKPSGTEITTGAGDLVLVDRYSGLAVKRSVSEGNQTIANVTPVKGGSYVVINNGTVVNCGDLNPTGSLRMIDCKAPNVRDLGGWTCDGGTIKYGKLFRGGDLAIGYKDALRTVLCDQLGIRAELNLRGASEVTATSSVLGDDIYYCRPEHIVWYQISDKATWKEILRFVFDRIKNNQPIYYHCSAGADRTGTVSLILEAILGVSQGDIDKDYELTSFAGDGYIRKRTYATGNNTATANYVGLINAINALPIGTTFRDKVINWVASLGFTAAEINDFRANMIDGTPDTITLDIDTYAVTNTLSNVQSDNADTTVTQYQPYFAKITTKYGYVISGVSIKVDGVDKTDAFWTGKETDLHRLVTLTLTNCTSSNERKTVIDGQSYGTILTASAGYTLDGVTPTITIGGTDMSTYYKNGTIAIPEVTGDIEITVTAIPSASPYTNQIPISTDSDGSVFNDTGYKQDYRITSSGNVTDKASGGIGTDCFATGFIPVKGGDVIRFSGAYVEGNNGGGNSWYYNSEKVKGTLGFTAYGWVNNPQATRAVFKAYDYNDEEQRLYSITLKDNVEAGYMRFTLIGNGANAVITVNEEIE